MHLDNPEQDVLRSCYSDAMLVQFAISLIGIFLFANPVIRANPVGASPLSCSHDGREYNVGETVVIDCDNCVCEPGRENCKNKTLFLSGIWKKAT